MATVEIEIEDGRITARASGRLNVWSASDMVVLHGRRIVAIGESGDPATPARPNESIVRRAAFEPRGFDPDVAISVLRLAIAKSVWLGLTRPEVRIQWAAWTNLNVTARQAFITGVPSGRVAINGTALVRPRVDVPILRLLFGEQVRTDATAPWVARRR